jgi:hypothetical protein
VPYSGVNYKVFYSGIAPNNSVFLTSEDSETMASMGFKKEYADDTKDDAFIHFYQKLDTKEKAYFFGSGKGAYWQAEDGPHYFNTVQELMQFLWDKYSPNIKDENWLKDYLRKWLM